MFGILLSTLASVSLDSANAANTRYLEAVMTSSRTTICSGCVILATLAAGPTVMAGQHGAAGGEWRSYAADPGSTKYSPLAEITSENVGNLTIAWRWASVDGRLDLDELRAQHPAGPAGPATEGLRPPAVRGGEGWGAAGARGREIQSRRE